MNNMIRECHNIVSVYLFSISQTVKLQEGSVGSTTGSSVGGGGVVHGLPGTSHWPAESEQSVTWPFGERQSFFLTLSQVPDEGKTAL